MMIYYYSVSIPQTLIFGLARSLAGLLFGFEDLSFKEGEFVIARTFSCQFVIFESFIDSLIFFIKTDSP